MPLPKSSFAQVLPLRPNPDTPFSNLESVSKMKQPSKWLPSNIPPNLDFMFQLNEHEINKGSLKKPRHSNITKEEQKALKDLSKMKHLIINKADKGGAVVIQNTVDYIRQSEKELSDLRFYKKVDNDLTEDHASLINQTIDRLTDEGKISRKIAEILRVHNPRTPQIYFLLKIHKGKLPPPGDPYVHPTMGRQRKYPPLWISFSIP